MEKSIENEILEQIYLINRRFAKLEEEIKNLQKDNIQLQAKSNGNKRLSVNQVAEMLGYNTKYFYGIYLTMPYLGNKWRIQGRRKYLLKKHLDKYIEMKEKEGSAFIGSA